jgi:D-arginine dehydrogenase
VRRVEHSWAGLRTFAPDRLPVLGYDPVAPDFFWAAGQGGHGIQIAPAAARACAAMISNEPIPTDLVEFGFTESEVKASRFKQSDFNQNRIKTPESV